MSRVCRGASDKPAVGRRPARPDGRRRHGRPPCPERSSLPRPACPDRTGSDWGPARTPGRRGRSARIDRLHLPLASDALSVRCPFPRLPVRPCHRRKRRRGRLVCCEVTPAVTVRGPETRNRPGREPTCDGTLDGVPRRSDDRQDPAGGMRKQIIHVPVTGVVIAGSQSPVAIDPAESASAERAPGVGVPAGGEPDGPECPNLRPERFLDVDHEGIRAALTHGPDCSTGAQKPIAGSAAAATG